MKRRLIPLLMAAALLLLPACAAESPAPVMESGAVPSPVPSAAPAPDVTPAPLPTPEEEEIKLHITIGAQEFTATPADTEAAREFSQLLPLTLDASELNGNEKYAYMDRALPAAADCPDSIQAGDLMLYGTDCFVLFYESFSTTYSYTPLGRIDDPTGLADAVGQGSVTLTMTTEIS